MQTLSRDRLCVPLSAGLLPLLACLLIALVGCDELSSDGGFSGGGTGGSLSADGPRIVSLTPALTQMLIDMDKRGQIVGVSREDDASLGLPVCGSYNDPVIAQILELEPDLVVTESSAADRRDVPPVLLSLSDQGVFDLAVIPYSRSIAHVERALTDAEAGLGKAVGDQAAADRARRLMQTRMELVAASVQGAERPRVLMLINPSTLGAIGSGVTHDELLELAGGVNAAASYETGYLTLTRSQVQQTVRPDVVLILEPGGTALVDDDPRVRALEGLAVPAVTDGRIVVIRHRQAMLPSTALPAVLVEMASAIHPDRAEAIGKAYALAELLIEKADAKAAAQAEHGDAGADGGGP